MAIYELCAVSFQLDGETHQGVVRIEQSVRECGPAQFQAKIETAPLHGTFGGCSSTVEQALDFLNLAMQAEGADQITFMCPLDNAQSS